MPTITHIPPNQVLVVLEAASPSLSQWVDINADRPHAHAPDRIDMIPVPPEPNTTLCSPLPSSPPSVYPDYVLFNPPSGTCQTYNTTSSQLLITLPSSGPRPVYVISAGEPYVSIRIDLSCPADIYRDSGVDINDLLLFLEYYQAGSLPADLTHDSAVTIEDLLSFLDHFQNGC